MQRIQEVYLVANNDKYVQVGFLFPHYEIFFFDELLESANIAYRSNVTTLEDPDAHGKEIVAAAQEIYGHLQNGTYLNWQNKERPIVGDLSKVSCVTTLSEKATIILANLRHVSSQRGGVQEARTELGSALFGARVAISPSSRHPGLVMRLSRVRANDPLLGHEDMPRDEAQQIGSVSYPNLESEDELLVDLPDYEARKCWRARGLCVIDAFKGCILLAVARVFGVRACPLCPLCNCKEVGKQQEIKACQDMFGSSMLPVGGYAGGCDALGGACEHLREGDPDIHMNVHRANACHHGTLKNVADALRANIFDVEECKQKTHAYVVRGIS